MQILGRKRRIMLAILAAVLLISPGLSFAAWDLNEVKALSASNTEYANVKVGDVVTFGKYYQTNTRDANGEYVKTPIEWLVVIRTKEAAS